MPEPARARAYLVRQVRRKLIEMKMRKEDKAALVDEIAERLGEAEAIFAVDYRGITVPQAAELRAKLADADTTFRVVKNRLARRATERAGTAELDPLLAGPTALALVKGDAVAAAKAIATFGRQHEILEYKGGLMDGAALDPDQFKTIARLPALDVLRGQFIGVVASPLSGLARGLASMLSGLAVALGQIQEQGLVGGEEEPAEAPKPTDEAPAEEGTEETAEAEPVEAGDDGAPDQSNSEAATAAPGEQAADEPSSEQKADNGNDDGSEESGSEEVEAEGETSEEDQ